MTPFPQPPEPPDLPRRPRGGADEGFALLIALIMLAAITVLVVSFFAVATSEIQSSSRYADSYRARLAAETGFEEAKDLLLQFTASDDYIVHSVAEANGMVIRLGEPVSSRYTFVARPGEEGSGVDHIPLWAGGRIQRTADVSRMTAEDYHPAVQMASGFGYNPDDAATTLAISEVRTLWSRYLDSGVEGDARRVESAPLTGWLKGDGDGMPEGLDFRYTFWVEDIQGFLDLENNGTWSDHYEGPGGYARDFVNYGYGPDDIRIDPALGEGSEVLGGGGLQVPGARFAIPGSPEGRYGYQFPAVFRGQGAIGQIAPGLCPREVHLAAIPSWGEDPEAGGIGFGFGPYAEYGGQGAWLIGNYSAGMLEGAPANRFRVGTRPYRERPLIPRGFGYPSEGEPRANLNALLADPEPVAAIADVIRTDLPEFESRAGAFPEDYLATIAANIIDYADTDGEPTASQAFPDASGPADYRGIDSYPFINEVFALLAYGGYETVPESVPEGLPPEKFLVHFYLVPYVEFWNPSNQPVVTEGLQLDMRFMGGFGFPGPGIGNPVVYDLGGPEGNGGEGVVVMEDQMAGSIVTVTLAPNEYRVVGGWGIDGEDNPIAGTFGGRHYVAEVENPGGALTFELEKVSAFVTAGNDGEEIDVQTGDGRVSYRLTHFPTGAVLDRGGQSEGGGPGGHGMVFVQMDAGGSAESLPADTLVTGEGLFAPGDYAIRCGNPGLSIGEGEAVATNWGDPRMAYYVLSEGGDARPLTAIDYTARSTPGGRNSQVDEGGPEVLVTEQQRIYHSPDGGYSTLRGAHPEGAGEPPIPTDAAAASPAGDPSAAPGRLSNLGRFYSVTELGHIYDPAMWNPGGGEAEPFGEYYAEGGEGPEAWDLSYGEDAEEDGAWGGFNTLRIGRPEHPRFFEGGAPAAALLDLFHTGTTGTNLPFLGGGEGHAYAAYDPRDHQWPAAAPDEEQAGQLPFRHVYPPNPDTGAYDLHAQGPYRWVYGHLNINSAPDVETIQTLLAGLYTADDISADTGGPGGGGEVVLNEEGDPDFRQVVEEEEVVMRGGGPGSRAIAERLYELRPFYAPSQLAAAFSENAASANLGRPAHDFDGDGDNNLVSDAVREEAFARLFNLSTLSSRHFRIYTYGQTLTRSGRPIAGAGRVYEVFLRPVRDEDGEILSIKCEVLSERDL